MAGRRQFGYISKSSSGRWKARYTANGKKHSLGTFTTKSEAGAALSAVETNLRRGTWIDPVEGRITFGDYAESWLKHHTDLRPRSRDQYKSLLKVHLVPQFGHQQLSQVSPGNVRTWHGVLVAEKPGAAPAAYRLLRAIFNTAVDDGVILSNPCKVKGGGSDRAAERPVPTIAEIRKLVDELPEKIRPVTLLAAGAVLRRGEVLGLQRRDLDLASGSIHVERSLVEPSDGKLLYGPTKNGESRTVHVSDDVRTMLESHVDAHVGPEPTAPLFTGRTGQPLRPGALWRAWDKARKATGLTQYHFHDLRHFGANDFSIAGGTTREVMARGGWKSVSMVARYQTASPNRDAEVARSLPRLVPDGAGGAA